MICNVARSPACPPDHTTVSRSPGCIIGIARPWMSPPPAYDVNTICDGVATGPRYPIAVLVSAGPVLVESVHCCGYHRVPSPDGPICTVAVPPPDTIDWPTPFAPIGA